MKITMYDPPEGWMYGFPRQYKPRLAEEIEDTLLRDGYPARLIHLAKYTRFWDHNTEEAYESVLQNPQSDPEAAA